jgi:hypothetical protein
MSESNETKGGEDSGGADGEAPLTVPQVVWAAARWVVKRELAIRIAVVAFLLVLGGGCVAYAARFENERHAPIEQRLTKLEQREQERDRSDLARDRLMMESNLNVRLLLESHGIKPIDVPRVPPDGGP